MLSKGVMGVVRTGLKVSNLVSKQSFFSNMSNFAAVTATSVVNLNTEGNTHVLPTLFGGTVGISTGMLNNGTFIEAPSIFLGVNNIGNFLPKVMDAGSNLLGTLNVNGLFQKPVEQFVHASTTDVLGETVRFITSEFCGTLIKLPQTVPHMIANVCGVVQVPDAVQAVVNITEDPFDFSNVVDGISNLFIKEPNLGITDEMLEGVASLFDETTPKALSAVTEAATSATQAIMGETTTVLSTKFPCIEKIPDYSNMMPGEVPEWLQNIFSNIFCFCNKIWETVTGIYSALSTALSWIGTGLSYAWYGVSHLWSWGSYCVVEHPLVTAGVVAFCIGAYVAKKYHLFDYAKVGLEVVCSGVEIAAKAAYCGAIAPACYGISKTWEYCTSSSHDDIFIQDLNSNSDSPVRLPLPDEESMA